MTDEDRLRAEYDALLEREGRVRTLPPTAAELLAARDRMTGPERAFFAEQERPMPDGTLGLFDDVADDFRRTLQSAGVTLPGPFLVDEYPDAAFNARATAVSSGALILINTGFLPLVHQISTAHGWSVRFRPHEEVTAMLRPPEATADDTERNETADVAVATAVLAYLFQGDSRFAVRLPLDIGRSLGLSWSLTDATRRFVVAHELAHVLEGHLTPRDHLGHVDSARRTREQEFQADETGALLCLRSLNHPDDQWTRLVTVAGPLFFLAIDHLITRVRNELDDIPPGLRMSQHPSSDERGAALRRLFQSIYGASVLQVADACVYWLAWRTDTILDEIDRQLRR